MEYLYWRYFFVAIVLTVWYYTLTLTHHTYQPFPLAPKVMQDNRISPYLSLTHA